jgi:hypothetical protein
VSNQAIELNVLDANVLGLMTEAYRAAGRESLRGQAMLATALCLNAGINDTTLESLLHTIKSLHPIAVRCVNERPDIFGSGPNTEA